MKKSIFAGLILCFSSFVSLSCAEGPKGPPVKVILMIAEQNIEGPQRAWWASEIDLSATESVLAQRLLEAGFEVMEPVQLEGFLKKDPAFRNADLPQEDSLKLGDLALADYVVQGKALASSGGFVPQSSMRSCFANLSAKLIRVKDGKVVAYLDTSGSSAHMDPITGGREALVKGAQDLAVKLIEALKKATGKDR
jgi:hypothetical protein